MRIVLTVWLVLSTLTPWAQTVQAAALSSPVSIAVSTAPLSSAYQVDGTAEGVVLTWQLDALAQASAPAAITADQQWAALQQLPQVRIGDHLLPMLLETVLLPDDTLVLPRIDSLNNKRWSLALPVAEPLVPPVADWQSLPTPTFRETQRLPAAPVFLLREGRMRGMRWGVIALSPLYVENGATQVAVAVQATIPGAKRLPPSARGLSSNQSNSSSAMLDFTSFTNEPVDLQPPPVAPTNPAVGKDAFKITVRTPGIQRLLGVDLLAAAMNQGTVLAQLHLTSQGQPLPLEIRDNDGLLDATSEVRFYASPAADSSQVGDRWNDTDTYWLTVESGAAPQGPLRMGLRNVFPKVATLRQSAYTRGLWEENAIYESNMPGVDGDHWFGAKLEVEAVQPDDPGSYPYTSITLTHALPLERGSELPSVFTVTGSARSIATHTLHVNLDTVVQPLTWSNQAFYENWQHTFTRTVQTDQIDLVLIAGLAASMIRVDKIAWQQPVQLDFRSQGATFVGVPGLWRYQLQNTPADRTLYDISDPNKPAILQLPGGPRTQFEDGPEPHTYLVTGPGTLHIPTIAHHAPLSFLPTGGADALYIAPAWLHDELDPLIEHRRQQGYVVELIDVQQIYDAWSYGQVAPEAIRDFLRYAVSHWNPSPIAVTLVGDSTIDPRNYTGMRDGVANVNVLPAYLAPIDPWISETACESCFAQLDGATPFDRAYDASLLVDIWLGRLSVQDEAQLMTVVDKILRYETTTQRNRASQWHQTALYITDNYVQLNGTKDPAGNFPYLSDLIIEGDVSKGIGAVQPPQVMTRRLYYDPSADGINQPWREPHAAVARLRTIEEINRGPGLITYNGHGNHFLWATTDPNLDPPYLFGANDVFELTNGDQPSILLEMTCFTAQFTYISPSGHTIDERFLRHNNGGAVAVWGSSGLTVAIGHDWMQQGFHQKLWQAPPSQARLGELTTAGYASLFASTACCQETRYVYLLLGDPLTPALIWTPLDIYLPLIAKP